MSDSDEIGSARAQQPKILQVLPRGMRYSRNSATSIDLFVAEVVAHSRFRVEVVAEAQTPTLPAQTIHNLPKFGFANTLRRARRIAEIVRREHPALLVVQQHLPSAAAIQAQVRTPVILQRHNFMRPPRRSGLLGPLSRARHARQLNALAGLTFVSAAVLADFEQDWPEVTTPRRVVNNGVDFANWSPSAERENFVLVVGRATAEKGLVEAAQALSHMLPKHPRWSARFVVSEPERDPAYFDALRAALAPLGDRAKLLVNRPFRDVQALSESAAIALVPSKWREPFGRTCLEAHAGGAAVISSGSGGLREISADAAVYLSAVEASPIAQALDALIADDDLRHRLAAEGAARVRRLFDVRQVAADLDDFCASVIERAARG